MSKIVKIFRLPTDRPTDKPTPRSSSPELKNLQKEKEGKNKPDSRSNHKLWLCVIQGNIVLSFVLSGWGLGFKQIHGLPMYTYNFCFLCIAHNLFLYATNERTDGRTDGLIDQWAS